MKNTQNKIGRISAIALALALGCSAVSVNAATASNQATQSSNWEQFQIIAAAKRVIEKERASISRQQDRIAEERSKITSERQNIVEQREIIANAEGNNQDKIIARARQAIARSQEKIYQSEAKIAKHQGRIAESKAEIATQQDIIAEARDIIAGGKDDDGDGVPNNIDLCPDTPMGDEVDADGCTIVPESDWTMIWNDEFDGTSIDSSKWMHEINCDGGGNQEKQCYTDNPENSFVEDGKLKIVALSETGQPLPYSSARLVSKDQGDWTYGRFEIRAKAPRGQGSWPAIWLLPTDNVYGGWPHSGEVDIFESVNLGVPLDDGTGAVESHVYGTLHYGESWPDNDSSGLPHLLASGDNPADDFHLYAMEWEEGEIRWYVDGVLYQTQLKSEVTFNTDGHPDGLSHRGWYREQDGEYFWDETPFDERFHMILNFAVGGSWPEAVNQGGVDASAFNESNAFEVDYVRVYECSIMPGTGQGCATVTDNYLDPVEEGGTLVNGAAPTPVPPSDGVAEDLYIFENEMNEAWPAWDCCGGTTPTVELDDADHAEVVEFVIGASPTVLGFNTNIAAIPAPYDGSPMLDTGVLEFDLKLVTPPNNASAAWKLKVEQGGTASAAELTIATPTAEWQHYAISLKDLSNAGLNLNGIDIVMIFPEWGQGEGAVFRVDNVTILEGDTDGEVESDLTPIDFEEGGFGASLIWNVFENVDNPPLEFVANPDTSGINDSSTVAKIIARADGAPWVGTETQHGDIGPFTLDATNSTIKIMVYKTVISDVGIKFAIANGGAQPEIKVANTLVNQWEELTFDFSGNIGLFESIDIDQIIVFPDFNLDGRGQENVVYFDNIRFFGAGDDGGGGDPTPGGELINNGSFDNGGESWIGAVNVVMDGDNNVYQADIAVAGNPWDVNLSQVLTIVPDETYVLSFRAKASVARSMIAGLGLNHDPWTNVVENVSLGTEWETYTYTLTASGFGDDNSRVLFDMGAETGVIYIDDVSVKIGDDSGGGPGGDLVPIDFEVGGFGASLSWNVFENVDNPPLEFVANPDTSGVNDSSTVAKIIARADGAPWVGTETQHGDIGPFTLDATNSIIKIMVYKTVISDVGIKFAIANGGAQPEIKVANTLVNQWEELTFDFTGNIGLFESIDIDQIIVFPDFNLDGRGQENVVYFDNIRFVGEDDDDGGGDDGGDATGTALSDFEGAADSYMFNDFDGGVASIVNNPDATGINTSAQVGQMQKFAGQPWGGSTLILDSAIDFPEGTIITLKVWSQRPVDVLLKLEGGPVGEVTAAHGGTGWEELSFDFTGISGEGTTAITLIFDNGIMGDAAGDPANWTFYFDDLILPEASDGGGSVTEDEFFLISSDGTSDIDFTANTVGEWSTGSQIQGDVIFDGLLGWEITSSSNSPEQGNWGTVLAFQNGINGDFSLFNRVELKLATTGTYSGGYKIAISGNGVNSEFSLPINEAIETWQSVSIDAADIPLNLSKIDWIAVYGIGGQMGVSTINITDLRLVKDQEIAFDTETNDDFVFISSDPNVSSDLVVDDDNNSDVGNVIFGEWSTGTGISSATYDGLDAIQLSAGGSWGAVLAFQGDISDGTTIDNYDVDLAEYTNIKFKVASQGSFERYALSIVSKVGDQEAAQEIGFSLANQTEWNEVDIDLAIYGIDLSNVNQVALFGVYQGGSASQAIYITDMVLYDSGKVAPPPKDSSDEKFVFFSSTGEATDMVFDDDDYAHNGNMTISDWSTGTTYTSDVIYNGLNSFELKRGSGSWGAVLALMGDINGGVLEYDFDVAQYSTVNLKIAALGSFSEYVIDFLVDGAEFQVPISVNSNWTEVTINVADIPLNMSKLTQISIFGIGGGANDTIYITDLNISK